MEKRGDNPDHLSFLDGIRGFAALWVLCCHALVFSNYSLPFLSRGDLAVDVFMIVSGFLMTFHYFRREAFEPWEKRETWLKFYIRRFFRIAPLYYVLLFIALCIGPSLGQCRIEIAKRFPLTDPPLIARSYYDSSLSNILAHVTFIFGAIPKYYFKTALPDWSIGLEMQFYLVFPFLILFLRRKNFIWPVILISSVCLIGSELLFRKLFYFPSFLPLRIDLFFIGILMASSYHYSKTAYPHKALIILSVILLVLLREPILMAIGLLILGFLFYDFKSNCFKIGGFLRTSRSFLGGRIANGLADASYAMYLLHLLVMIPMAEILLRNGFYLKAAGWERFVILFICTFIPTYFISRLFHRLIEKPGIAYGKFVVGKLFISPVPACPGHGKEIS